ncbi:MAG: hypothetical protein HZA25_02010 [Candidatus Niyogibacteria bacterium]|nr:hypothetical protein [Candidatus Niyogibacteria bacterium]
MLASSTVSGVPADTAGNVAAGEGGAPAEIRLSTAEMVKLYAKTYGANETSMLATLKCESELKHESYGDGGLAYGIAQFHEATFNEFKELAGLPELDYRSKEDQIQLMAWAFAHDSAFHWSCWRKYKAKQLALLNRGEI